MSGKANTLTVTNVSWASDLGHNLLSTVPLAKKGIEVFLKKKVAYRKFILKKKYLASSILLTANIL